MSRTLGGRVGSTSVSIAVVKLARKAILLDLPTKRSKFQATRAEATTTKMNSMEEAASSGVVDPARLAQEAPKLVRSASRAMEGLATEVQSCDGSRRPMRCAWKVGGPGLGVLEAYMLVIWGISAGAGDKLLALQARDAVYFIQRLQDMIEYGRLQSTLRNQSTAELLPALRWCLPLFASSKPRRRIMKGIKVVKQETLMIGHLLEKGAANQPQPPVPDSGRDGTSNV